MCIIRTSLVIFIFLMTQNIVYADNSPDVQEGAETYNWQTCISNKTNACLNDCVNSEDPDCNDNCNQMANDKCISQGVMPPAE